MTIPTAERNISATLKMDVPQMRIEFRLEISHGNSGEHDHSHAATNVIADDMRHHSAGHIDHNPDRDRLTGVKVRRRNNAANPASGFRQFINMRQCVGEVRQGACPVPLRLVTWDNRANGMT
jgi:hypothetical protein